MAEYASASLINGQTGYPMRPPSIHGGNAGGLVFAPPGCYPAGQDVFLQTMLPVTTTPTTGNGAVFPLMVSCSSGLGTFNDPISYMPPPTAGGALPSGAKNPFDTLKSIDTLPPHEEMR